MNPTGILLFELGTTLSLSITALLLLRPHLYTMLVEICGAEHAAFWVMFTQLMVVCAPLLLVVYFSHTLDFTIRQGIQCGALREEGANIKRDAALGAEIA